MLDLLSMRVLDAANAEYADEPVTRGDVSFITRPL